MIFFVNDVAKINSQLEIFSFKVQNKNMKMLKVITKMSLQLEIFLLSFNFTKVTTNFLELSLK